MRMYRLSGSYHSIGAEYGAVLRGERMRLPNPSQTRRDFAAKCEPFVREHAPYLLDEIAGIAEGGGYELERIQAAALVMDARPACSVIAIAGEFTADGKPLVGRNLDWNRAAIHAATFCHAAPEGARQSLACTDLLVGRHGGVNDAGLAIGIAMVMAGRDYPGIMFPLAARIVLDRYATTAEAVEFLCNIRHARPMNFLVADAGGDIAIVEVHRKQIAVIRPPDGCGVITNQYRHEAMTHYEQVGKRPPDSMARYRRLREWFLTRPEPLTHTHLQAVLSTPKPRGVRMGDPARRTRFDTIWSWTASLGADTLHLAAGIPGDVPYKVVGFE
ncbi:MAG: hypothetical protein JXQ72_16900 [Anaerolineae bacterium]|nr:hypothetical protein [Anaerolineae bacterium]